MSSKFVRSFQHWHRRRRIMLLSGLLILTLVLIWLVFWLHQRLTHINESDAHIVGEVISLASRESGWLTARPVIDGDEIKKDQILAQIDDRDAKLRLAALEGSLAAADAQIDYSRAQRVSRQAPRNDLTVLDRQIEMERRQRLALLAQADQLKQDIADRALRSPVNGVVDRTFGNVGDYIQEGQWVMMVHDPLNLWVEANIKETAIEKVKVGQQVDIAVDACWAAYWARAA